MDWNVRAYEACHRFVWQKAEDLVEWLKPHSGERIIDLGCGTGHLTASIASRGATVVGIDSSRTMLERARRNFPDLTWQCQDARNFKISPAVDAVFSNAALHWIPEASAVVRSIQRALKPHGRFIAEFGGEGNIARLHAALHGALASLGRRLAPSEQPWYFPSVAEYRRLLSTTDFQIKRIILFDRPTLLAGGQQGLRNWIETFGQVFLAKIPENERYTFYKEAERLARPALYHHGSWWADYRRLRLEVFRSGNAARRGADAR